MTVTEVHDLTAEVRHQVARFEALPESIRQAFPYVQVGHFGLAAQALEAWLLTNPPADHVGFRNPTLEGLQRGLEVLRAMVDQAVASQTKHRHDVN